MDIYGGLTVLGQLTVLLFAYKSLYLLRSICIMLWGKPIKFTNHGKWAVITGSTDGIGKAYAEELARLGMDVILISRTLSKLQNVAKSIEERFSVKTRVIAVDFTKADIWDTLTSELKDLDIGVLINNVGMGVDVPAVFTEVSGGKKFSEDIIKCNMCSLTFLMHHVMPKMLEKRKGVIVNVGSFCGIAPGPLVAVYAATKAYVNFLSRAVEHEYRNSGVIVQTLMPGLVSTKLIHYVSRVPLVIATPNNFARSALRTVGKLDYTSGYWIHEIQTTLLFLVRSISPTFVTWINEKAVAWSNKAMKVP